MLGALAPAERASSSATARLPVLPPGGRLTRRVAGSAEAAWTRPRPAGEPAPPSLLPRTLQAVVARRRVERRRRTWYAVSGAVAAAVLAAAVGLTVNQVATAPQVVGLPVATPTPPGVPVLTAMRRPGRPHP